MAYLANTLIENMDFDINQLKRSKYRTKRHFTSKYRKLSVYGKDVNVKLTPEDFNRIVIMKL